MNLLTMQYEAALAAAEAARLRKLDPLADITEHEAVVAAYVAILLASFGGNPRAMEFA